MNEQHLYTSLTWWPPIVPKKKDLCTAQTHSLEKLSILVDRSHSRVNFISIQAGEMDIINIQFWWGEARGEICIGFERRVQEIGLGSLASTSSLFHLNALVHSDEVLVPETVKWYEFWIKQIVNKTYKFVRKGLWSETADNLSKRHISPWDWTEQRVSWSYCTCAVVWPSKPQKI